MFGQPFRFQPIGQPDQYKTYQIVTPQTPEHYRPATCAEVECEHYIKGWRTAVPGGGELEAAVRNSGRLAQFIDHEAAEVIFTFAPGTPCFRASTHRIRTDKPDVFVVRGGDWRGNPRGDVRLHKRPEDWVEDFTERTSAIRDRIERG